MNKKEFKDYGDQKLIFDCQRKATGADIHDVSSILSLYRHSLMFYEEEKYFSEDDRKRHKQNADTAETALRMYRNGVSIKEAKKFQSDNWILKGFDNE